MQWLGELKFTLPRNTIVGFTLNLYISVAFGEQWWLKIHVKIAENSKQFSYLRLNLHRSTCCITASFLCPLAQARGQVGQISTQECSWSLAQSVLHQTIWHSIPSSLLSVRVVIKWLFKVFFLYANSINLGVAEGLLSLFGFEWTFCLVIFPTLYSHKTLKRQWMCHLDSIFSFFIKKDFILHLSR